jgi:hypothetical protein
MSLLSQIPECANFKYLRLQKPPGHQNIPGIIANQTPFSGEFPHLYHLYSRMPLTKSRHEVADMSHIQGAPASTT